MPINDECDRKKQDSAPKDEINLRSCVSGYTAWKREAAYKWSRRHANHRDATCNERKDPNPCAKGVS